MKKKEISVAVVSHIDNYSEIPPAYRILPPVTGKQYISIDANNMPEATELYNAALKELGKKWLDNHTVLENKRTGAKFSP